MYSRGQIQDFNDRELVQTAFEEYWADFGINDSIDPRVRSDTYDDLKEAERQLETQVVLAMEGRGRLRSFLLNECRRRRGRR
jgi:hypothetical protein